MPTCEVGMSLNSWKLLALWSTSIAFSLSLIYKYIKELCICRWYLNYNSLILRMYACMLHVYIDMYRLYIEWNNYVLTYWEMMLKHDVYRIHIFLVYITSNQITYVLSYDYCNSRSSLKLASWICMFFTLLDCCCFLLVKKDSFVLAYPLLLLFLVCCCPCWPCCYACLLC